MMDLACLFVATIAGVYLRLGGDEAAEYFSRNMQGIVLLCAGILVANYVAGSYRMQHTFSRFNMVVTWLFSLFFALLLLAVTSYSMMQTTLGRGVLALTLGVYSLLALSLKLVLYQHMFRGQVFLCRCVIIGEGGRAIALRRVVESDFVLPPHKVVANIRITDMEQSEPPADAVVDGIAVLNCPVANLDALIRSLGVSLVIVGREDPEHASLLYPKLKRLRFEGVEVLSPLSVYEIYRGMSPLEFINEEILMQASLESSLPLVRRVKRLIDLTVSILALLVLLPVFAIIYVLIKLSAPRHPAFYSQTRVGQFGRRFEILKFRSMAPQAEESSGPVWASVHDPRITPLGHVLRRFRLDELPQFVNILRGEMSLVGPRPERPEMIRELEAQVPFFSEREMIPPGLTGWAQVRYPYGATIADASRKLEFDLYYMKHLSLSLDLQILLSTLQIVMLGKERGT